MKVGVISDTHDNIELINKSIRTFIDQKVDVVIHCGDFISPFSISPFDREEFTFYATRGNNDGEWGIVDKIQNIGKYLGEADVLRLDGISVAVYHGTNETLLSSLVESGNFNYVLHGHTHEYATEEVGITVRVNPGGLPLPFADDAFHIAILDTKKEGKDAVQHIKIE